ncbi:MAG: hypothetical protein AAF585_23960, partial [Verrucomicrobiota bacterium]
NQWLVESPENAARFAERSHMHSHLFEWAAGRKLESAVCELPTTKAASKPKRRRWKVLLPIAAGIVLLLAASSLVFSPKPGDPLATLQNSPGGGDETFSEGRGFE